MFQDEYILGFEKMLSESWMLGVKLTRRDLKSAIDDICDPAVMSAALVKKGIDPNTLDIPGCLMFNPGGKNTFSLRKLDGSGRTEFVMDVQGRLGLHRRHRSAATAAWTSTLSDSSTANGKRASTTPTVAAGATWKVR